MVKIRLARRGRKKLALYDIVIANARVPRDGRFIEKVGNYDPNGSPSKVVLKIDAILKWLSNGAQPSPTVKSIFSSHGLLLKNHLELGIKKGAITREIADQKFKEWEEERIRKAPKFNICRFSK
jgi:small subunit ribosomal protein S16